MDPATAIATATAAFGAVKKLVKAGRSIEDTFGQLGRWYGAIADLNEAERKSKNPPLFKKLVAAKSVEQEALEVYAAKKKALEQEKELRVLLMYTYGPTGYSELVSLRRQIRERREREIYAQQRRRRAFFWGLIQLIAIGVMLLSIYYLYDFLFNIIQS